MKKATAADWIGGARLRTLPLAIAPVALGTASAYLLSAPGWHWVRALLALAVALALQIGVNYANDYSDGVRGTGQVPRGGRRGSPGRARRSLGPCSSWRSCSSRSARSPGVGLVVLTHYWWLLAVGAVAIAAAYFYTGGRRPYGYYGLGELFVFVFFGLVAVAGTTFTQVGTVNIESWLSGGRGGIPRLCGSHGEQPARHRAGQAGRQANARGAGRELGRSHPVHGLRAACRS